MRKADLQNWFSYHAPTPFRLLAYEQIRQTAVAFADLFDEATPDSADKTAAMRKLRETVMAMNLAIACNPSAKEGEL